MDKPQRNKLVTHNLTVEAEITYNLKDLIL